MAPVSVVYIDELVSSVSVEKKDKISKMMLSTKSPSAMQTVDEKRNCNFSGAGYTSSRQSQGKTCNGYYPFLFCRKCPTGMNAQFLIHYGLVFSHKVVYYKLLCRH